MNTGANIEGEIMTVDMLKADLRASLAETLFLEHRKIDIDAKFIDIGLDSILGVEWVQAINRKYDLEIPAMKLFDYPTINDLAKFLYDEINCESLMSDVQAMDPGFQHVDESVAEHDDNFDKKRDQENETIAVALNVQERNDFGQRFSAASLIENLKHSLASTLFLGPSDIDIDKTFIDIGLDSILAVEWVQAINRECSTSLQAAKLFDYPTVNLLARYLHSELISAYDVACRDEKRKGDDKNKTAADLSTSTNSKPLHNPALYRDDSIGTHAKCLSEASDKSDRYNAGHPIATESIDSGFPLSSVTDVSREKIAVIGVAGQFPMANSVDEFWQNIAECQDCISEMPVSRWPHEDYYDPDASVPGKTSRHWAGVLERVDEFDPLFFNISPAEAQWMDPQQRLFLQNSWHAIEDAGIDPASLFGTRCGVFVGCAAGDYGVESHEKNLYGLTGGTISILAARISYLLNLKGPCLAIDTACSASLVALVEACNSLLLKTSDLALTGGVSMMAGSTLQVMMSEAGMLSARGRCFTFDQRADGFVAGEGVGVVLLKRLSDARRDGDNIQGVISGWGSNQDGKTNGITAPSAESQYALQSGVFKRFNIDPGTIGLVEAHGTGTKLGDPIEIEALKKSFAEAGQDNRCALGSVKSNVGHLATAAGISGFIKALMALKHRKLPPTINFETQNSHISLVKSPFFVNTELQPWVVEPNALRRATVSSFGFSGTNAFVILEEWQVEEDAGAAKFGNSDDIPAIIVLSAKTKERLSEAAVNLIQFLAGKKLGQQESLALEHSNGSCLAHPMIDSRTRESQLRLVDLAYTLQVGRQAMEERLAFTAKSLDDVQTKLQQYLDNEERSRDIYCGRIDRNNEMLSDFSEDDELREAVRTWIRKRKIRKLLNLWVNGLVMDWGELYGSLKPRRICLPMYPFLRQRYWVPALPEKSLPGSSGVLHPMLHENTSDLSVQRFSSWFTGDEFYLSDHRVHGQCVLPAVAYLEMVREAVCRSVKGSESSIVQIEAVSWLRPLIVETNSNQRNARVDIELFSDAEDQVSFELSTAFIDEASPKVLHGQGKIRSLRQSNPLKPAEVLDLPSLKAGCVATSMSIDEYYSLFSKWQLDYGPGFRALNHILLGQHDDGTSYVLAEIHLPVNVSQGSSAFCLHPSLMDAALQAAVALYVNDASDTDPAVLRVPFSLQSCEVFAPCISPLWVWVRASEQVSNDLAVECLDIDICNGEGEVCVRFRGFCLRISAEPQLLMPSIDTQSTLAKAHSSANDHASFCLRPLWRAQSIDLVGEMQGSADDLILLCELGADYPISTLKELATEYGALIDNCWLTLDWSENSDRTVTINERFKYYCEQLFVTIQDLVQQALSTDIFIQVVVAGVGESALMSGLSGLLKSVQLENPHIIGQVIGIDSSMDAASLIDVLVENRLAPETQELRYPAGVRSAVCWEVREYKVHDELPWKTGGVYLITGGAGGLGLLFAEAIAGQVAQPVLILTGRSARSAKIDQALQRLQGLGAKASYHTVDVADGEAVNALVDDVNKRHGALHGILHSAGVVKDNFILKKTVAELQAVLRPKVDGVVHLDEASEHCSLDFFAVFSSLAGVLGNLGQSDYAAGNAFMDAYVSYRNELVRAGKRQGHTVSMNWPQWRAGGMKIDAASEAMIRTGTGLVPLATATGLAALHDALSAGDEQVMVLEGDADIPQKLSSAGLCLSQNLLTEAAEEAEPTLAPAQDVPSTVVPLPTTISEVVAKETLTDKVQMALKQAVSSKLKVALEDIDLDAELNEFGFDSITLTEFGNVLNETYQINLLPTTFFEYPTLRLFADYLVVEQASAMTAHFGSRSVHAGGAAALESPIPTVAKPRRRRRPVRESAVAGDVTESIAVVGMSGRFPMAGDLDAFWDNLVEGKDCISEVPQDRWDWQSIYGDPKTEVNKTNIKWGGFIEGVDEFDPLFFGISPQEAQRMDPQQRLLMTYAWKVIEEAGYSAQSLSGSKTAIYVGTASGGYTELLATADIAIEGYSSTGVVPSVGPNRMSYLLDLHGPSEPIETACSSALVAIHRAVETIRNGSCDQAIVGGINTIVTPAAHIAFSKAGMLSEDGRCKTFSPEANGYVRGEGVGMLLLKRLSEAEAAGDHIYGVIRGSAENHGGRSNSLTAPNPQAQSALLEAAYHQAGIDPRSVGYIEAHGTGTALGDPIEVNGLKSAFKTLYAETEDRQEVALAEDCVHCGLGSVKTNIGHLELAAGIAGVIKVLLQLKHKTLVKSLHSEEINPYIELADSPFYIVDKTSTWEQQRDGSGQVLPRRAGVSSFGFGGVNAHVVLEEYVGAVEADDPPVQRPVLMVLSAKSEEQLLEQARQLQAAIVSGRYEERELVSMGYTLQVGRDALQERLALLVSSLSDFEAQLGSWIDGCQSTASPVYCGSVQHQGDDALSVISGDAELQIAVGKWLEQGKYEKLMGLWVKGLSVDWSVLYGDRLPRRLALPTYPFAKEKYWIANSVTAHRAMLSASQLHPLLQENTSDLSQQKYSSVFTGEEFFLSNHIVQEKRILPAVAYIEMAREAMVCSLGVDLDKFFIRLEDIAWGRPIIAERTPLAVHIALHPDNKGGAEYKIYTENHTKTDADKGSAIDNVMNDKNKMHCHGRGSCHVISEPPQLDISLLKSQSVDSVLSIHEYYDIFKKVGLDYGEKFRAIERVLIGNKEDGNLYVLAKLGLQGISESTSSLYTLHPSLMDSALQASIALIMNSQEGTPTGLRIPFALESCEIFAPCQSDIWARIEFSADNTSKEQVEKLDIDLCNDNGKVCVSIRGLSSRVLVDAKHSLIETDVEISEVSRKLARHKKAIDVVQDEMDADTIHFSGKASTYFKKLLSSELALPANRIDVNAPLENYGIDSVMTLKLTSKLEETFGPLSKTLFFEYQTIKELSGYFLEFFHSQLLGLLGIDDIAESTVAAATEVIAEKTEPVLEEHRRSRRFTALPVERDLQPSGALDIAIVGLSGRYPQARDVNTYWQNLREGKDCITEIPKQRWNHSQYFDAEKGKSGKTYSKWGGFIDGVDEFDPLYFNISPAEAEMMDPQERLFLQCAIGTLEDAGYTRHDTQNVGVYVGVMYEEYQLYGAQSQVSGKPYALSGVPSSIANRVSYFCNFHGPSLAIDSMCSSSLSTIHIACQSILQGDCELALAGGVNVSVHPNKYLMLSQGQFISSQGRCQSFGKQGDGYVPGEGVGAVLLKPLSRAVADRDHIYGVIKGTAINHGGKTNGYSVPNPRAQANVIRRAFESSGIDPRTISYIEAHGTGTSLGDPIEITGLSKAYREFTNDKAFCAIGSAKSNIGHCESAAGIAGVTKVLMQLQHQQLAPSLHSEELNPNIDFAQTPFVVQQTLADWKRPVVALAGGAAQEYPRRAGVSSFGAGGANAHVVIEEYTVGEERTEVSLLVTPRKPALIVLSAKSEVQLYRQVDDILSLLNSGRYTDTELASMAYTLQVGREEMEERLALQVTSLNSLKEKLENFLAGLDIDELYRGQVRRNQEALSLFSFDEDIESIVTTWIHKRKFDKLLAAWVKGMPVVWEELYEGVWPQRISLPSYPFAEQRYWIPKLPLDSRGSDLSACLHPLVHENTSELSVQRFCSSFTGDEFFLSDHRVHGQSVLPAVAYLEMAREATVRSLGVDGQGMAVCLRDVTWLRPVVVGSKPVEVSVELIADGDASLNFEISTQEDGSVVTVYSQGAAHWQSLGTRPQLDIAALQGECRGSRLDIDDYYRRLSAWQLDYGPSFRSLEQLMVGQSVSGENYVLAQLRLPESVSQGSDNFALHPSLMDAALQSAIALVAGDVLEEQKSAYIPFALCSCEVFSACDPSSWAWVRASGDGVDDSSVHCLDIDVCDGAGQVCVSLRGLSLRPALSSLVVAPQTAEDINAVEVFDRAQQFYLRSSWQVEPIEIVGKQQGSAEDLIVLCELGVDYSTDILQGCAAGYEALADNRWLVLDESSASGDGPTIGKRFERYAVQLFEAIQKLTQQKLSHEVFIQVVICTKDSLDERRVSAGLSGLLQTARLENPRLLGQIIDVDGKDTAEQLVERLVENRLSPETREIRCRDGQRFVPVWEKCAEPVYSTLPWKTGGVYLITGGAGGLGLLFAEAIAGQVAQPVLILTGRSARSAKIDQALQRLQGLGAKASYHTVDVADGEAVNALVDDVNKRHGALHGILHSAGVVKDNFILKKTVAELQAVLRPKVDGVVHLDEASEHCSLDFFAVFSSLAGVLGNLGQSDYAAGNAFMDAYVSYRNELVRAGKRQGHTVSMNWPQWRAGGMKIDAASEAMIRTGTGLVPLATATGLAALHDALSAGDEQVMVLEGDADIPQKLSSAGLCLSQNLLTEAAEEAEPTLAPAQDVPSTVVPLPTTISEVVAKETLTDKVQMALKQAVSSKLKVALEDIDLDAELNEFGFDSITLTEFGNVLNETYQINLLPTTFFEYPTLRLFADYLVVEQASAMTAHFGSRSVHAGGAAALESPIPTVAKPRRRRRPVRESAVAGDVTESIAVVGMSGRFPMAGDLDAFWDNLVEGKDCISEVPQDRWDWQSIYGDPKTEVNKTNIKWGGFIEGVDEFDPLFFGISPQEAQRMDPQQRLLMTYAWKVIEEAGYSAQSLSGSKTAIYVGTASGGYTELLATADIAIEGYSSTGVVPSVGPNRMSYLLDLHGPSEPIETACSSALVAIHRAVETIRNGSCDQAIVGGINTIVTPAAHIAFSKAGMLSEDGRCKTFSPEANGYVRGEGVGMLLLKRLSEAEAAGDHIYGVIRGSAENHGGRSNSLTAPNPQAQSALLEAAYHQAGIDPRSVGYIEAHGTGTALGDPIEVNGLKSAFKTLYAETEDRQEVALAEDCVHCGLGSVKTNIGHLELAAGIAGVIKVLLQLKHKTLVKSLHSEEINPYIELADSPFYIVDKTSTWEQQRDGSGQVLPRRAGVSSFGFGGVNAHVVLEEYVGAVEADDPPVQRPVLMVLSAKSEEQLLEQARQLQAAIVSGRYEERELVSMGYTLQVGRDALQERLALLVSSLSDFEAQLGSWIDGCQSTASPVYCGSVQHQGDDALSVISGDAELQIAVGKWLEQGKYEKLMGLWVKGLSVDWSVLYGDRLPRRLALPTYPFAKEKYWIATPEEKKKNNNNENIYASSFGKPFDDDMIDRLIENVGIKNIDIDLAMSEIESHF